MENLLKEIHDIDDTQLKIAKYDFIRDCLFVKINHNSLGEQPSFTGCMLKGSYFLVGNIEDVASHKPNAIIFFNLN